LASIGSTGGAIANGPWLSDGEVEVGMAHFPLYEQFSPLVESCPSTANDTVLIFV
jgi:hypothetical protein